MTKITGQEKPTEVNQVILAGIVDIVLTEFPAKLFQRMLAVTGFAEVCYHDTEI